MKDVLKEKRKGCCTYSWSVSAPCLWTSCCQSLGVALFGFFLNLFPFFLPFFGVFLCPFSLGFSIQTRYLSSIVSLDTFAHAHSLKSAGMQLPGGKKKKEKKKFGTIYHFDNNLIWSGWRIVSGISFGDRFSKSCRGGEGSGAHCKK